MGLRLAHTHSGSSAVTGKGHPAPGGGVLDGGGRASGAGERPASAQADAVALEGGGLLTHIDGSGKASMVDVGYKAPTRREAVAAATVALGPVAYGALTSGANAKGDVLAVARVAGILAAKKTAELIPLCHPLLLSHVGVEYTLEPRSHALHIRASAACAGGTGVEMEAMTAAAVVALTVYDMCKAASKGIVVKDLRLVRKSGGKSGEWRADDAA